MTVSGPVPDVVRNRLAHGYLQLLADHHGVDVLHLKGAAVAEELLWRGEDGDVQERVSSDVDLLVRPAHVGRFVAALKADGWKRVSGFEEGSAFGHAKNLRHRYLGMVDVHRSWPGFQVSPDTAFNRLWRTRATASIGHVSCTVPDVACQRLVLLLHVARSGGVPGLDRETCWEQATTVQRDELERLASELDAHLALAAALGRLDEHRSDPRYRLWRYFADGQGSRLEEWSGRWQAAGSFGDRWRVARAFLRVNPDLLRDSLGREPTRRDHAHAFAERCGTAARDLGGVLRGRLRRREGA